MTVPEKIAGPTVAIIGLGPKGLWCLEALVDVISRLEDEPSLHVVIFNNGAEFGVSPVYDTRLPEYLLLNSRVGELKLWGTSGTPAGPSFDVWLRGRHSGVVPHLGDYMPRALAGAYLGDGFRHLMRRVPPNLRISSIPGEAIDVVPYNNAYTVRYVTSPNGVHEVQAQKILLATGHTPVNPSTEELEYIAFGGNDQHGTFIPAGADLADAIQRVQPGTYVAMKGIALTFIDAALLLTEGRGGIFRRARSGKLVYEPSGREPVILPYSRTGLPMVPKPCDLPYEVRQLAFVTEEVLSKLRQLRSTEKLNLESDIWPLVECEMKLYYYRVAAMGSAEESYLEECDSPTELERIIESFLRSNPHARRFDLRSALDPVGARRFASGMKFNGFVERYLADMVRHAYIGIGSSGYMSAFSVWFDIREVLRPFIAFGGLESESHRSLIEIRLPLLKRVGLGPPIINAEKLVALVRAGIVDFAFARRPHVLLAHGSGFEISSPFEVGLTRKTEALVDARCPPVDVERSASRLLRNMRQRGLIRAFENVSFSGAPPYRSGAIDISADYHHVIDVSGRANPDIAAIGIPTEGNLVGNFSIGRDEFASVWANDMVFQLGLALQS